MTPIKTFLKDLENEAILTRKMLGRVPEGKDDWQPHPKSMKLKPLAIHIAELPEWIELTLQTSELDFEANPYSQVPIHSTHALLEYFEQSYLKAVAALQKAKEEDLEQIWILRKGEDIYSTSSKAEVMRMALNQIVHHRAQLGVFLRLLNIPIPGSYGPSADDMSF